MRFIFIITFFAVLICEIISEEFPKPPTRTKIKRSTPKYIVSTRNPSNSLKTKISETTDNGLKKRVIHKITKMPLNIANGKVLPKTTKRKRISTRKKNTKRTGKYRATKTKKAVKKTNKTKKSRIRKTTNNRNIVWKTTKFRKINTKPRKTKIVNVSKVSSRNISKPTIITTTTNKAAIVINKPILVLPGTDRPRIPITHGIITPIIPTWASNIIVIKKTTVVHKSTSHQTNIIEVPENISEEIITTQRSTTKTTEAERRITIKTPMVTETTIPESITVEMPIDSSVINISSTGNAALESSSTGILSTTTMDNFSHVFNEFESTISNSDTLESPNSVENIYSAEVVDTESIRYDNTTSKPFKIYAVDNITNGISDPSSAEGTTTAIFDLLNDTVLPTDVIKRDLTDISAPSDNPTGDGNTVGTSTVGDTTLDSNNDTAENPTVAFDEKNTVNQEEVITKNEINTATCVSNGSSAEHQSMPLGNTESHTDIEANDKMNTETHPTDIDLSTIILQPNTSGGDTEVTDPYETVQSTEENFPDTIINNATDTESMNKNGSGSFEGTTDDLKTTNESEMIVTTVYTVVFFM